VSLQTVRRLLAGDVGWLLLLVGLFAATTRWSGWDEGIALVGGSDVYSYRLMSDAAPALPTTPIASAYSDRYLVHWTVGTLAAVTGLSVPSTYRIAWLVAFAVVVLATHAALRALDVAGWPRRLCLALVVLNPYAMRYYALVPAYLADVLLQAGVVLAVLGLAARRPGLVLGGVLVAVAARQTILVVLPVLAVWLLLDRGQARSRRARQITAGSVVVLPLAVLAAVRRLTRGFTEPFSPGFPDDTILPVLADLPTSAVVLADHVLRVAAPHLLALSIGCTALLVLWRHRGTVPLPAAMCALVSAAVVCQPLGIGPAFPGFSGNEPRLSALGLIPLVLSVGVLLVRGWPDDWGRGRGLALTVVVVAASLHHLYTVVGPADVAQFMVVQVVAAAAAVLLLLGRSRPVPAGPGEEGSRD
jgi:hypothetical protein